MVVKPILIVKIVGYKWKDILSVFASCIIVALISIVPSFFLDKVFDSSHIGGFFLEAIAIVLIVCIASFVFGTDKAMKQSLGSVIKSRLKRTV